MNEWILLLPEICLFIVKGCAGHMVVRVTDSAVIYYIVVVYSSLPQLPPEPAGAGVEAPVHVSVWS